LKRKIKEAGEQLRRDTLSHSRSTDNLRVVNPGGDKLKRFLEEKELLMVKKV
jgi:hypothetical protein